MAWIGSSIECLGAIFNDEQVVSTGDFEDRVEINVSPKQMRHNEYA